MPKSCGRKRHGSVKGAENSIKEGMADVREIGKRRLREVRGLPQVP